MSDNSIVPKSSLRPNDVLLGRGNGAINYCGNVAFRALVATRRGEYAAAVTETSVTNRGGKTAKARIADEVMQCVLSGNGYDTGVEPGLPGRFLKQASATVLAEAGLGGKQSDQYWIECTRSEAMIKVKMALRQIDRKEEHKEARRVARAGSAQKSGGRQTSSAEAGASAAKRPKANHPSSSELESAPTPSVVASSSFAANALPLMVGHNGAASLGAGSLIAPGLLSAPADSSSLLATMNNPASAGILQALVQQQQLQQQLLISGLIGSVTGASGTGNMLSTLRASVATPPNLGSMVLSASTPNAAASSTSTAAAAPAHAVAASVVNTNSPLVAALRATSESIGGQGNSNLTSFVSKAFNAVSGMVSCHNQSLSFASVLAGNPASQQPSSITGEGIVSGEVIRSDLALFGSLLFEELTGTRPEVDRSALELYDELINKGFPTSLCTLVCCLLDSESRTMDVPPCLSADEVAEDLKFLMENHQLLTDPEVAGDAKSIWDASRTDNLWGRSEQMGLLMDAFKHVVEDGGPLRAVFISGVSKRFQYLPPSYLLSYIQTPLTDTLSMYIPPKQPSGTGKTVMIEHLYEPLRNKNGGLISIKFQELGQKIPLSLIFEGLDQYCTDLLQGDAVRLALTRKTLSETLGSQFYPLYQLIPNLRSVVSTSACSSSGDSDGEGIEGELALNRILVLVRAFIAAIASPEHPVVFVADDLQWSDESSLHLITTILTDTSNCLLFVGLYRDDEVGPDHVLNAEIEKWRTMNMPTVDIRIRNLDLDVVNNMLAYRLKLVPHMTLTLAEIVTQKTDANPLFINELLHSLCSDNLITYFEKERRWKWDDVAIQGRGIADNVVELICGKLRQLAVKSQQILMNAACLGSQSEESSLRLLWGQEGDIDFDLHLALLVTEGLLCKVNEAPVRFSFSHDRIQEAVYARLIPSGERAEMHLNIARILRASELCSDQRVYTVVDQYVRARDLVVDQDERIEVARLCLDAGIKASLAAAFSLSSWCLSRGVQFLCDSDWESEYHLCLRCHSKCAVSQHIIGEHTNALKSLEPVFKYGKTLLDTMESSLTFIEVQSALVSNSALRRQEIVPDQTRIVLIIQICFSPLRHIYCLISLKYRATSIRDSRVDWSY